MLKIARKKCKQIRSKFINHDLTKPIELHSCDVVIINLVLQFLPIEKRNDLIKRCYETLKKGGVLIIVEKTLPENEKFRTNF